MAKIKKVNIPDWVDADIGHVTLPEFSPNQTTMDRFDREPLSLTRACSEWWRALRKDPHISDPEYQIECGFNDLTAALMLWAQTHGLGDGMVLADAAAGGDIWRAQTFLDAMRNRAQLGTPSVADEPKAQQPAVQESGSVLINAKEAAKQLGIGVRTLYKLRKRGLPYVPVGRLVKYDPAALQDWAKANMRREQQRAARRYRKSTECGQKKAIPCSVARHFGAQ